MVESSTEELLRSPLNARRMSPIIPQKKILVQNCPPSLGRFDSSCISEDAMNEAEPRCAATPLNPTYFQLPTIPSECEGEAEEGESGQLAPKPLCQLVPESVGHPNLHHLPVLSPGTQASLQASIPWLKLFTYCSKSVPQQIILPKVPDKNAQEKKMLILDLDHTLICHSDLIHSNDKSPRTEGISREVINTEESKETTAEQCSILYTRLRKIPFVKRPFLQEFLELVSKLYEVYIFTASETEYAMEIVTHIDPFRTFIQGFLTRDSLSYIYYGDRIFGLKELASFVNRSKDNIIIVDDSIHAWALDLDNLIPIKGFYGDADDNYLPLVGELLKELVDVMDIRDRLHEIFALNDWVEYFVKNFENKQSTKTPTTALTITPENQGMDNEEQE